MYRSIEQLTHTDAALFSLLGCPCVIEGAELALYIAETTARVVSFFLKKE